MIDTKQPITNDEYLCEECGTTTPVQNDSCPNCGGKLMAVHGLREPTANELDEEEAGIEVTPGADTGTESLESLAAEELNEDQKSYNEDSYGDDD